MEQLKRFVVNLDEKLTKIGEDIAEIKVTQAEQAKDLKYHIKRSDMNEQRIETVENRLIPILELKTRFDGAFKFVGMVGSGLGVVFGAVKLIELGMKFL